MSGPQESGRDAGAPRRVAVLGATGFIGRALAVQLAERPITLRLVARRAAPVPAGARADVEVRTADLTAPGAVEEAVAGADAVVCLVAHRDASASWRVAEGDTLGRDTNVGVLTTLLDVLRARASSGPPPACVFTATVAQVGLHESRPLDGTEPDAPTNAYGRQKLEAERALEEATASGAVRGVSVRLPTVYGPGDPHGVVTTMARRALAGDQLTMWGEGTVLRDLVYVDDVASALRLALDHADALAGRHWLIGSEQPVGLGDLFRRISQVVGEVTGKPPVPVVSVEPPDSAADTDFQSLQVDASRFRERTGWSARVALDEGLRRTVAALAVTAS